MVFSLCLNPPFDKDTSHIVLGPTPISQIRVYPNNFILANSICNDPISK